jgi:hypothetical protein
MQLAVSSECAGRPENWEEFAGSLLYIEDLNQIQVSKLVNPWRGANNSTEMRDCHCGKPDCPNFAHNIPRHCAMGPLFFLVKLMILLMTGIE